MFLQIRSVLKPGTDLHISAISTLTRQILCQLLDPVDPLGKDWCLLAVKLGLVEKLPKLETTGGNKLSQTARLLDEWEQNPSSKIGKFESIEHFPSLYINYLPSHLTYFTMARHNTYFIFNHKLQGN